MRQDTGFGKPLNNSENSLGVYANFKNLQQFILSLKQMQDGHASSPDNGKAEYRNLTVKA